MKNSGFRDSGSGFRVQGSDLWLMFKVSRDFRGFKFRVYDARLKVQRSGYKPLGSHDCEPQALSRIGQAPSHGRYHVYSLRFGV